MKLNYCKQAFAQCPWCRKAILTRMNAKDINGRFFFATLPAYFWFASISSSTKNTLFSNFSQPFLNFPLFHLLLKIHFQQTIPHPAPQPSCHCRCMSAEWEVVAKDVSKWAEEKCCDFARVVAMFPACLNTEQIEDGSNVTDSYLGGCSKGREMWRCRCFKMEFIAV